MTQMFEKRFSTKYRSCLTFFLAKTEIHYYYFCDSRNIIEISIILLFLFSTILVILKNSDILFSSDYKREN